MRQRCPATVTRVCNGDRPWGCSSAGRRARRWVVAADQQMVTAGVGVVFGAAARSRPRSSSAGRGCRHRRSVSARPVWAACAGSRSTRIGPAWVGTRRLAAIGQHIAQAVAADRRRAAWGRRRRPRRRPPTPRAPSRCDRAGDQCCGQRGFGRETPLVAGDSGVVAAVGILGPRLAAGTGRGRSGRARAGRHRSDTPRPGSSRSARRCRCTGAAPRPCTPFFTSPVSSTTRTAPGSPKASMT